MAKRPKKCFNCDSLEHRAATCPNPIACLNCDSKEHRYPDCTLPLKEGLSKPTTGSKLRRCFICGEVGHFAHDCPDPDEKKCFTCRAAGHLARDCPMKAISKK